MVMHEPWKVLIKNNIFLAMTKNGKNWKRLYPHDLLYGKISMKSVNLMYFVVYGEFKRL